MISVRKNIHDLASMEDTRDPPPQTCRTRRNPIPSHGIIVCAKIDNVPKFLLIKKRDSYAYVCILRGNWKNHKNLRKLFIRLTREEQLRILTHKFKVLWKDLWGDPESRYYRNGLTRAKRRFVLFESLKDSLRSIQEHSCSMWEFPKGRKNANETNFECALREFEEETTIPVDQLQFTNQQTTEVYQGTDKLLYSTNYYICVTDSPTHHPPLQYQTLLRTTLSEEVEICGWFSIEECRNLLSPRRAYFLSTVTV